MRSAEQPSPAELIIRRFGGQSALAALLGRRQSTVEHWAQTGRIPAQWQQPLMSLRRHASRLINHMLRLARTARSPTSRAIPQS